MTKTAPMNRRSLIAAAAALAGGAAVNAGAIVAAKSAQADPIFAAIKAHRRADAEWSRLHLILDQMPRSYAKINVYAGMTKPWSFAFNGKLTEFPAEPLYLRTHEEIDKQFAGEIERCAALHTELQRREEAATTSEAEAVKAAASEACDVEREALQDFIETVPTTPGGLSAMLSYLLERQMEYSIDQDDMKLVLKTLAVAVASIPGGATSEL